MAKHVTDQDIEKIVSLIDQWNDEVKFTWDNLCGLALKRYSITATRQTLQSYSRIKSAYGEKKKDLRDNGKRKEKIPPSLKIAARRIATLEAENSRLKKEQEGLLAQFVVWQYNAYAHGISMEKLNNPLPKKNSR
ncbi:hypothetical protein Ga0123461_1756 [Mariprofundus aestuarium]|uniref:Uncharacterized protein n=1 Tax=Mariprofundus aestuarium TaxID=1921086 RepID=A0A2K8L1S4_MARES|nr:hypothetical protein [Mariprofundus aestuarium]ATX80169.1 hypothetical protein Ga0123461_1756 [Mariprofundus aestuarium]